MAKKRSKTTKKAKENEWIILVGGSAKEKRDWAENECKEIINRDYCNPPKSRMEGLLKQHFKPKDLKGYDGVRQERLLLGNIDDLADVPKDICAMLLETSGMKEAFVKSADIPEDKAMLLHLYWDNSNVLFLNNFFCEDTQRLKLSLSFLEVIIQQKETFILESETPMALGELILGLEGKKDLEKLPEGFRDLFKILSLDIEVDYNKPSFTYMDKVTKSQYIRIKLFEFLRMNDGVTVTREEINICLWDDKVNDSDFDPKRQLDQHISGLRKDLERLGIKNPGKVIETIGKTQLSVGGYKYHSELI